MRYSPNEDESRRFVKALQIRERVPHGCMRLSEIHLLVSTAHSRAHRCGSPEQGRSVPSRCTFGPMHASGAPDFDRLRVFNGAAPVPCSLTVTATAAQSTPALRNTSISKTLATTGAISSLPAPLKALGPAR